MWQVLEALMQTKRTVEHVSSTTDVLPNAKALETERSAIARLEGQMQVLQESLRISQSPATA